SEDAGLDFAAEDGRGFSGAAWNLWRGRHGAESIGFSRRALHGLRRGGEPHRVRQGADKAALPQSGRADGKIFDGEFSGGGAAKRFFAAAGGQAVAAGVKRRTAICRARRGLVKRVG